MDIEQLQKSLKIHILVDSIKTYMYSIINTLLFAGRKSTKIPAHLHITSARAAQPWKPVP